MNEELKTQEELQADIERVQKDLTEERNTRCIPIANAIIKLMAKVEVEDKPAHELARDHKELIVEVMNTYLKMGARVADVNYINRLVLASYDVINSTVVASLNRHLDASSDIFWQDFCGKELDSITLKDLDDLLLKNQKVDADASPEERMTGEITE